MEDNSGTSSKKRGGRGPTNMVWLKEFVLVAKKSLLNCRAIANISLDNKGNCLHLTLVLVHVHISISHVMIGDGLIQRVRTTYGKI